MSNIEAQEQPKSNLSILSDKIDRLESLFLEAFTNPGLKPTANSHSEFLYAGNGKFNSFDELQESVEKKLSYLLRTTDDLVKRMESLISNLSNLENTTIRYRLHEKQPSVMMPPSGFTMTPPAMRQNNHFNPHMFKGHSYEHMPVPHYQNHPGGFLNPQMFNPELSRISDDCLTIGEFIIYLHSPEVDLEGMFDPQITMTINENGMLRLTYNPHNLPTKKLTFKQHLINSIVNGYHAICYAHPLAVERKNIFIVLKNNDEKGEDIPVKNMDTFINWIIDNEIKQKKIS